MTNDEKVALSNLFTDRAGSNIGGEDYGTWRTIAESDAAPLHFGFPFPDSFPVEELRVAATDVLEKDGAPALQYSGDEYGEVLEKFIANRARERGIDHADDGIVLTNGATHAIDLICRVFLDTDETLLVEAPTFMGALSTFRDHGVEVMTTPLDEDGLDIAALEDSLADRASSGESLPKLLYTIPNFHNPAGVTMPIERRNQLLDLAVDYDFVILEDDAYGELRYDGEDVSPLAAIDDTGRVLHVGTVSKTIAPGLRTGWVIADPPVADEIDRIRAVSNTFIRSVIGRYCEMGQFDAVLSNLRRAYAERRDHMLSCLDTQMPADTEWTKPEGGFFVWVTLPDGVDATEMLDSALQKGVAYLPGGMFFPNEDSSGNDHLRLSFSHADPSAIDRGISVLAAVIRESLNENRNDENNDLK